MALGDRQDVTPNFIPNLFDCIDLQPSAETRAVSTATHRATQLGLLASELATPRWRRRAESHRVRSRAAQRLGLLHDLRPPLGEVLAFFELDLWDAAIGRLVGNEPDLDTDTVLRAIERHLVTSSPRPVHEPMAVPIEPLSLWKGSPARSLLKCPDLSPRLASEFRWIAPCGLPTAFGQVHRAMLVDGTEVAVKVRPPDWVARARSDLVALNWLETHPASPPNDGAEVCDVSGAVLRRRLDFRHEAEWVKRFQEVAAGNPEGDGNGEWKRAWHLPRVIERLSGESVLTTTWIHGDPLGHVCHWSARERAAVARTLVTLFLGGVLRWGFVQADPHPWDYRFRRTERGAFVGIMDFGGMKPIDPDMSQGLRRLIRAVQGGRLSIDIAFEHCVDMGFHGSTLELFKPRLTELVGLLLAPLAVRGPFDTRRWNLGHQVSQLLGERRLRYRIGAPPCLSDLVRALHGLTGYLNVLGAPVDWSEVAREFGVSGH